MTSLLAADMIEVAIQVASEGGRQIFGVRIFLSDALDVRGPVLITRLRGTGGTGGRVGILVD